MLTGSDFVQLIGEKKFVGVWKDIRDDVNPNRTSAVQGKVILDGLWSSLMTGFAFGSRNINIDKPMSRQLKGTYLDICQNSARNIYQVAKDINRPYNRVYADVKLLQEIGLIKALSSIQAGRKVSILSVPPSIESMYYRPLMQLIDRICLQLLLIKAKPKFCDTLSVKVFNRPTPCFAPKPL